MNIFILLVITDKDCFISLSFADVSYWILLYFHPYSTVFTEQNFPDDLFISPKFTVMFYSNKIPKKMSILETALNYITSTVIHV